MNTKVREEVIYIKSQIIYFLAFSAMFYFSMSKGDISELKYFVYLNTYTIFISSALITLYVVHVVVGWFFEERNFYQRSLIYSFVLTLLLVFAVFLLSDDGAASLLIFFGIIYFIIIEVPRLTIVFLFNAKKLDFKFLTFFSRHIKKIIILYLMIIVLIDMQYFNETRVNQYILQIASSMVVILVMMFYAWRLNSKTSLSNMKKVALIVAGILFNVIMIKVAVSLI